MGLPAVSAGDVEEGEGLLRLQVVRGESVCNSRLAVSAASCCEQQVAHTVSPLNIVVAVSGQDAQFALVMSPHPLHCTYSFAPVAMMRTARASQVPPVVPVSLVVHSCSACFSSTRVVISLGCIVRPPSGALQMRGQLLHCHCPNWVRTLKAHSIRQGGGSGPSTILNGLGAFL